MKVLKFIKYPTKVHPVTMHLEFLNLFLILGIAPILVLLLPQPGRQWYPPKWSSEHLAWTKSSGNPCWKATVWMEFPWKSQFNTDISMESMEILRGNSKFQPFRILRGTLWDGHPTIQCLEQDPLAMENCPCVDDLPTKHWAIFPWIFHS